MLKNCLKNIYLGQCCDHKLGVGEGVLAYLVCAATKGTVFAPFWCENGNRLCQFWSGWGGDFEETTRVLVYKRIYRFLFQMNKKATFSLPTSKAREKRSGDEYNKKEKEM